MVAVCAVNVPGFPIPRARVAAGIPVALVAAGTGELVDLMLHQDTGALAVAQASYEDRLRFVENVMLGRVGDSRQTLTAAVEVARRIFDDPELEGRLSAMRASVHPERALTAAALRDRVHPERTVIAAGLRDRVHGITAAALRERVHGGGGAVPFREGSSALTAATPFAEDMHPRGRDGQFIEKLGIVELFDVKGAKPGQRGKVTQIVPTKQRGRPDIIVELQNDDGSIGKSVKVKPDQIESAPEKARLPGQGGPGGPALREAGNVYVGEKIMLPGDLEGTVISTEPVGDRDGMRITTDMGVMDLRMSDTVTVVPGGEAGVAPKPPVAPGSVNLPDGTPLEPGSEVELNGEVFTVNALEPDPANPGGGLAELDDGSGMPSASKGWYNVDQLSKPNYAPAPAAKPRPGLGPRREPRRPSGGIDWSQEPKGLGEGATEFNPSTGEVTPIESLVPHNYAPAPPPGTKPTRYAQFDRRRRRSAGAASSTWRTSRRRRPTWRSTTFVPTPTAGAAHARTTS